MREPAECNQLSDCQLHLDMMKMVRKLSDELGKTVILVLHEINYAAFYSDYICAFKNGKIAKYGTVEEVIQKEVLSEIYQVDFEILNIKGKPFSVNYLLSTFCTMGSVGGGVRVECSTMNCSARSRDRR